MHQIKKMTFLSLDCEPLKVKGKSFLIESLTPSTVPGCSTDAQCIALDSETRLLEKAVFLAWCCSYLMSMGKAEEGQFMCLCSSMEDQKEKHGGCERKRSKT